LGRVGRDLKSGKEVGVKMYYILPGYLQMEAITLRIAGQGNPDEHPYNDLSQHPFGALTPTRVALKI